MTVSSILAGRRLALIAMGTLVGTAVTVTAASCASTVPSNASKTSADGSVGEGAGGTGPTFSGGAPEGGNAAACVAGSCTASNGATSVGQGPVLLHAVERHLDRVAHRVVDVDDKRLLLVPQEDGAPVGGGHHPLDRHGYDVILHGSGSRQGRRRANVTGAGQKGKQRGRGRRPRPARIRPPRALTVWPMSTSQSREGRSPMSGPFRAPPACREG